MVNDNGLATIDFYKKRVVHYKEQLDPTQLSVIDEMASTVRDMADIAGLDRDSYEFKATWCLATTFLRLLRRGYQAHMQNVEGYEEGVVALKQLRIQFELAGLWHMTLEDELQDMLPGFDEE